MKLPIKKKYFDMIKSGDKNWEYRDAHITFVCEETGEQLRKEVNRVILTRRFSINPELNDDSCFSEDILIGFELVDAPSKPLERDLKQKGMKQCKHRYGDWCHNPKQEHQEHCDFYLTNQNYENCSWFELKQKDYKGKRHEE